MTKKKSYNEGVEAFTKGESNSSNPYPIGGSSGINPDRYEWFMGWYDKKYEHFFSVEEKTQ